MCEKVAVASNKNSSRGPFVYGFIDLFSGSGESWNWGLTLKENKRIASLVESKKFDGSKVGYEVPGKKVDKNTNPLMVQDVKQGQLVSSTAKLDTVKEEKEDENKSISTSDSPCYVRGEAVGSMEEENEVSYAGIVLFVFGFWILEFHRKCQPLIRKKEKTNLVSYVHVFSKLIVL